MIKTPEKPVNTKISQDTINEIVTSSVKGKTQTLIAKELGIKQNTVSKYINKPENIELSEILKERLKKKYVTLFVNRKIKDEQQALKLSDYAYDPENVTNNTIYKTADEIEKNLSRQDKCGLKISEGTGILDSNTMRTGDDYSQHITISPSYQAFLDFQSMQDDNKLQTIDVNGDTIDSNNDDNVHNS